MSTASWGLACTVAFGAGFIMGNWGWMDRVRLVIRAANKAAILSGARIDDWNRLFGKYFDQVSDR